MICVMCVYCIESNSMLSHGRKNFFFQDYEVLDLLGKGGFASVYRSRCMKTGIEVAIKMVQKRLLILELFN